MSVCRLLDGISDCVACDRLRVSDLRLLAPYQPCLSAAWLFQRSMSLRPGQQRPAEAEASAAARRPHLLQRLVAAAAGGGASVRQPPPERQAAASSASGAAATSPGGVAVTSTGGAAVTSANDATASTSGRPPRRSRHGGWLPASHVNEVSSPQGAFNRTACLAATIALLLVIVSTSCQQASSDDVDWHCDICCSSGVPCCLVDSCQAAARHVLNFTDCGATP